MLLKRSKVSAIKDRFTLRQFDEFTEFRDCKCSLHWPASADKINSSHLALWQSFQRVARNVRFLTSFQQKYKYSKFTLTTIITACFSFDSLGASVLWQGPSGIRTITQFLQIQLHRNRHQRSHRHQWKALRHTERNQQCRLKSGQLDINIVFF